MKRAIAREERERAKVMLGSIHSRFRGTNLVTATENHITTGYPWGGDSKCDCSLSMYLVL